jgi:anti-sigma regulatory factor (Ser/Thr protein kinase)
MALSFLTVSSSKNNVRFGAAVDDKAVRDFVVVLYDEVLNRGFKEVTLDFRRAERAYPEAILPIICLLDHRRIRGNSFSIILPESQYLSKMFLNANWAHLVDPSQPKIDMEHRQHLPARRYTTHTEQQHAVDAVVDVVLRNVKLERDSIAALEWTVNELTDNVLNHARSPAGGLVQVSTFGEEHRLRLVVADSGRGIPAAMRETFPHLRRDGDAIKEAVKAGVTSVPDSGQGNGLAGSLRIAEHAHGSFKLSSGEAQLAAYDDHAGRYRTKTTRAPHGHRFPGTLVMTEMATDHRFSLQEALELGDGSRSEIVDVVDLKYSPEGGGLMIRMAEESLGVGTRQAGVELRRKCQNLLGADPDKRLVLDWTGVSLISSSFADEAVGKLFVELGPTTFSARVSHAGTDPLVRSLLDRAVMQRVVQSMRPGDAVEG